MFPGIRSRQLKKKKKGTESLHNIYIRKKIKIIGRNVQKVLPIYVTIYLYENGKDFLDTQYDLLLLSVNSNSNLKTHP